MTHVRAEVVTAIARARSDLDLALARLESLAADDRQRVSYSVHALNNYLMVVSSTLQLLRTRLSPGDRDVRRWLDSLKQATNLMLSTTRGVLTTTPDVFPLILGPASFGEIGEAVCRAYTDIARAKRVRIAWRGQRTRRDSVMTDSVAAGAVLDNLVSNAVKYSTSGSAISMTMKADLMEVSCSVSDHGPGLSEDDQANLFQRGVSLTAKPTAGETSSGHGLAIAKDLATALGGRLSYTSVLGQGSCFTFSLPLLQGAAVA